MPTYETFNVGKAQSMEVGSAGPYGYGFSIVALGGKPLLSILYNTEPEAKEAHAAIMEVLARAASITTHGP